MRLPVSRFKPHVWSFKKTKIWFEFSSSLCFFSVVFTFTRDWKFCWSKCRRGYRVGNQWGCSAQCVLNKNIKSETDVIIVLQQYTVRLLLQSFDLNWLLMCEKVWSHEEFTFMDMQSYFRNVFTKRRKRDFRVNLSLPSSNETQSSNRNLKMRNHGNTLLGIKPWTTNQTVFNVFIWNVLISFWIIATFNVWCYVLTFNHFLSHTYPIFKMKTYCCQIPGWG